MAVCRKDEGKISVSLVTDPSSSHYFQRENMKIKLKGWGWGEEGVNTLKPFPSLTLHMSIRTIKAVSQRL